MYRLQYFFKSEKPTQPNWSFLHSFSPFTFSNGIRALLHSGVRSYFPELWGVCAIAADLLRCCTADGHCLGGTDCPPWSDPWAWLPAWSCLMRLAVTMQDLAGSRPWAAPGFLRCYWALTTFSAVLFSWCNCISKLRFEDITHALGGCNSTDFHRVVFMQKKTWIYSGDNTALWKSS